MCAHARMKKDSEDIGPKAPILSLNLFVHNQHSFYAADYSAKVRHTY